MAIAIASTMLTADIMARHRRAATVSRPTYHHHCYNSGSGCRLKVTAAAVMAAVGSFHLS